jgi:hypothetical protein
VAVGDGSWEGNGVVVVIDRATRNLAWFAFFEASGAFTAVTLVDGVIDAVTDAGVHWYIRLDAPLEIRLSR